MSSSPLLQNPARGVRILSFLIVLPAMLAVGVSWHIRRSAASQVAVEITGQAPGDQGTIARNYGELPLSFERNDGQSDRNVKFISRAPGLDLFLTSSGAVINLRKNTSSLDAKNSPAAERSRELTAQLYLEMIGANQSTAVNGNEELPGKVNYLIGDDPAGWHTDIPTFRRIKYSGIFPSIDLVYYGNRRQLEYDFVLGPRAKVESIKFRVHGAGRISIGSEGDLLLATGLGEVQLRKPDIYQLGDNGERQQVQGAYRVKGSEIGFTVGRFDSKRPLVIDPVLAYATLLGAGRDDFANGIAVDSQGFAYVAGSTGGGFPTTAGSFQPSGGNASGSGFITKLDQTGTSLIYSTYLAGAFASSNTTVNGIVVDSSGNATVTGSTTSADFPVLNGIRGGRNNLLITNDSGASWAPSNVGTANRPVQALAIDKNTPTTMYACIGTNSGGIFKTTDGGLNWVALNTGVLNPTCNAIVIDPVSPNNVFAALTSSNGLTNGVYKTTNGGTNWVLANTGIGTIGVTTLAIDPQNPMTLYASGANFYKTTNGGTSWATSSTGMNSFNQTAIVVDPITPTTVYAASASGIFKTTNGGGNWALAITGLNNTTVRPLAIDPATPSTLYAGTLAGVFKSSNSAGNWSAANVGLPQSLSVSSLAVDPTAPSNIYLGTTDGRIFKSTNSGSNWSLLYATTTNTSFPALLVHPSNSAKVFAAANSSSQNLSDSEAFITKLNSSGSALVYSTMLGGTGSDAANAIAVDAMGNMYVAGLTNSIDFPTVNAAQATFGGTLNDAFVMKLNSSGSAIVYSTYLGGPSNDAARCIAVDSSGNAYVGGDTSSSTKFATVGAFQTVLGDSTGDAFASKFDANGALVYATYLGGNFTDFGRGIAADSQGNAYVTGTTESTNFPVANAIRPNNGTNGGFTDDAFVTKVSPNGNSLVYSTYLGGSDMDFGQAIMLDANGNAYVTGSTASIDFPLVAGAIRTKSPLAKSFDGGSSWRNDSFGFDRANIIAMAIDPTATSKVYAGTDTKNYRSVDGGRTWTPSMNGISSSVVVRSIVISPATPSTVYLATNFGSTGVFKSNDGGQSWNPASNGLLNAPVGSLVIDPSTPATLYAATGSALFKSIDNAGSWTKIGPSTFQASKLVIDPVTPTTLYAAMSIANAGVSKSIDSGATWQTINTGLTSTFITDLAIDPKNPTIIYASAGGGGFFKTTNAGASWVSTNANLTSPIAVDPTNPANVYATSLNSGFKNGLFKSIDGGTTWSPINNGLQSLSISAILVSPTNSSIVYAANSPSSDSDAFVTKLNPAGNVFVFSTLIGGNVNGLSINSASDQGSAIALDAAGSIYIAGTSSSNDLPSDQNVYQPFNRGSNDAFIAKLFNSYIISGQVLDSSNAPVSGAQVTVSDGSSLTQVFTESDGAYQFTRLREGGSFTVAATKPHFTMAPANQTFSNLAGNQTQNFVATATNNPFYVISGQLTANSNPLSGVKINLTGSQQNFTITDVNGNYSFTVAGGGNYTVTPSITGFSFSTGSQTFNNLGADSTANFAGTRQNFVVTNANDHGTGSLRQAMLDANATPGLDTITFNIPAGGVQTINLLISLPIITDPVVIDATTQPGYSGSPLIELNGSQAGTAASGFQITAGNSTIRGFVIGGFSNNPAIVISGAGGNTIQANYIGIDSTGTVARTNRFGIQVGSTSNNNLIGGTTASARNVISGSTFAGISLGSANNTVQGNFIGTNASGSAAISNFPGIEVQSTPQLNNNLIGGTAAGAGNLISGNTNAGITLGPGNTVQGNLIGTDVTGLKAIPNNGNGITDNSGGGLIGGTAQGARNVISGNSGDGVAVGGVNGNLTTVQGNFIGTDITGNAALGNTGSGISTSGAGVTIGGTSAAARNIISGNAGFGNVSLGSSSSGAMVQGNYIGTDVTGNVALTNPKPGISIQSSGNTVGGTTTAARNIISGNGIGIQMGGNTTAQVGSNLIQGNFIGVNQSGAALPNTVEGIRIDNSSNNPPANNVIGGVVSGAANTIAFNGGAGVFVSSGTADSVRGNSIFSNGGLGIDLAPGGPTANDQGDADTGANNRQNYPVLTSLTPSSNPNTIVGTLNAATSTSFTIDFYTNATCDSSGSGEGAQYLASTTVTTGADGNAAINFTLGSALPAGTIVTATATDPAGNSSEFSPCLSGAIITFSQSNYAVTEGDGSLNVTVVRTGDTAVPVAVDYATSDGGASAVSCATPGGKASAKCDFTDAVGTVRFAAGETSKTITVLVTQDNYVEGPETFTLALSNVIAATLQSPSSATITINDEVTEPPGNAIDLAATFVRQHYHDFLNREPDQSGLDFWAGQITSCGGDTVCTDVKRINVSGAFFLSIEFQQTGYLVERVYKVAYGDATGTSTLGGNSHNLAVPTVRFAEFLKDTQRIGQGVVVLAPGWEQALENNKQAYAQEFVSTSRFTAAYPATMTPAQFVDLLNQHAGNVLSLTERTAAINMFGGAANTGSLTVRAQVLRNVAEDQDLFNAESNRAFVLAQYFGYLRRNPNDPQDTDYTGYEFWLGKLNQFNGDYIAAEMVKAFIASSEYRQRFGP